MALEVFVGAAVGKAFSELTKAVLKFAHEAIYFKPVLDGFKSTLDLIEPVILEIEKLDSELDLPVEETKKFTGQLEAATKLVLKSSKIQSWNMIKRASYSTKLKELDVSLVKFFQTYAQALQVRDIKKIQGQLNEICAKLDGRRVCGPNVFVASCGAPEAPAFTVGLVVPLHELKTKLLKDLKVGGVQVLVLSAPGGCGKTTLAKMFCHDVEIKDTFRDNIFFVKVSKTPNLNLIVHKMFQQKNLRVPEYLDDDDEAIDQLQFLLKEIGQDPILLVLDDVWPGSESLVEKFKFGIPGYRILITSRSELPRFDSTYKLRPLSDEDAMDLFRPLAFPQGEESIKKDLVDKIVRGCRGFPLALTVVARSLCGQPEVTWGRTLNQWSEGQSIFDSNGDLLICLKTSIDALDEKTHVKECFLDLVSFPDDQRIHATALLDMWVELYNLDEGGRDAVANIHELASRNLVNLVSTRKDESEIDGYYHDHFVTQHDLLRDLAIHQSSQECIEQRKRLIMEIKGNDLSKSSIEQIQPFHARLLSISTDETFSSSCYNMQLPEKTFFSSWFSFLYIIFSSIWFGFSNIYKSLRYRKNMRLPEVEVLILNFRTRNYSLPKLMEKMDQLKVLIISNYGFYPAELSNFQPLGLLSSLKRIRLERVAISFLSESKLQFRNLRKISLIMCKIGDTFGNCTFDFAYMFPNLEEIDIHCCSDLVKLPEKLCDIICLKKLSITKCNDLNALPERLGVLTNLEVLRLHHCTGLSGLPDSVVSLHKLRLLDISDCLHMRELPIRIGELCGLEKLDIRGCGLHELPSSVKDLGQLKDVICDEDTAHLWEPFKIHLTPTVLKEDKNLNWLHNLHD